MFGHPVTENLRLLFGRKTKNFQVSMDTKRIELSDWSVNQHLDMASISTMLTVNVNQELLELEEKNQKTFHSTSKDEGIRLLECS